MNDNDKLGAVRDAVARVVENAKVMYGVNLNPLTIDFTLKDGRAGLAGCVYCQGVKNYRLRFNRSLVIGKHFVDMISNSVPHEVAHLVCFANPSLGKNHNNGWKRVCIALGGNGKRLHDYEVDVLYARGGYDYMTDLGHKVTVSSILHKRIQSGLAYRWRNKGRVSHDSMFCIQGGIMPSDTRPINVRPVIYTVAPQPKPGKQPGAMSKAEIVREWIRAAKNWGGTQESVINQAIERLSMSKSMATKYVIGNWDRVKSH